MLFALLIALQTDPIPQRLFRDLGNDSFAIREQASHSITKTLYEAGVKTRSDILAQLKNYRSNDLEVTVRIRTIMSNTIEGRLQALKAASHDTERSGQIALEIHKRLFALLERAKPNMTEAQIKQSESGLFAHAQYCYCSTCMEYEGGGEPDYKIDKLTGAFADCIPFLNKVRKSQKVITLPSSYVGKLASEGKNTSGAFDPKQTAADIDKWLDSIEKQVVSEAAKLRGFIISERR